jgi:hypothetical protein
MGLLKTCGENKILSSLTVAAVLGGAAWFQGHIRWSWEAEEEITANEEHLAEHNGELVGIGNALSQIPVQLEGINSKMELFVDVVTSAEARAQVMTGPGVQINRRGELDKYLIFATRMSITNKDHEDQPTVTVDVGNETFSKSDSGLVLKVGRDIADRLGVPPDQWFFRVSVRRVE